MSKWNRWELIHKEWHIEMKPATMKPYPFEIICKEKTDNV